MTNRTRNLGSKLGAALEQVAFQVPDADRRVREANGDLIAAVRVGNEAFTIMLGAQGQRVLPNCDGCSDVEIKLAETTFDALLSGRVTLHDAICNELVFARGATGALLSFGESLAWFLKGVLRTSTADALLDSLEYSTETQERFT